MAILAKKNKLTILRYLSQGSRIVFAFVLVIYAKKQGNLTDYGRLLNVCAIYAMLTSSALMPFLNQLWKSFSFSSIFKKIITYFFLLSVLLFIVSYKFIGYQNLIIISVGGFVFVITNVLIQYSQTHKALHYDIPMMVMIVNSFFILYIYFFAESKLILLYFTPYILLGLSFFYFFRKIKFVKKPVCNWKDFNKFLKRTYGWSLLLSLCWPLTFLVIREIGATKDLIAWEDYEFYIRLSMSVLGLASGLIINYNLHSLHSNLKLITTNLLFNTLIPAYLLLIAGYFFIYIYIEDVFLFQLIIFFLVYLLKIALLSFAYPLLNLNKVKSVSIIELLSSVLIIIFFKLDFNVAFSFLAATLFSSINILWIWRKRVNSIKI